MLIATSEHRELSPYFATPQMAKPEERLAVAFEIIKSHLPLLQYPVIGEGHLINPFEERAMDAGLRVTTSLKISPLQF